MLRNLLSLALACGAVLCVRSQPITLRVMDYNLLNFPEPNPPGKADTLAKIIAHHPVDLLICEEIRTAAGAQNVLDQALNVDGETRFSMAAWEPMHSDPGADYFLQQIIYYDHNKLTLKEQGYLTTYIRDLNWYTLYVNTADLAITHDTTFFTVFAVHLKAGDQTYDVNERNAMAQVLVDFLPSLPADRHVIVAGDMNLYSAFEPAFQTLLDDGNAIDLDDPIGSTGSWNNNSAYAPVHTQSTRVNVIFSDGAGGGLDDRFDVALLSSSLLNSASRLHYATGTYRPLGNSGDCFNQNVLDCDASATPYAILRALYYMSDHLPVVFDLVYDATAGFPTAAPSSEAILEARSYGWQVFLPAPVNAATFRVRDLSGRAVEERQVALAAGATALELGAVAAGMYTGELWIGTARPLIARSVVGIR